MTHLQDVTRRAARKGLLDECLACLWDASKHLDWARAEGMKKFRQHLQLARQRLDAAEAAFTEAEKYR